MLVTRHYVETLTLIYLQVYGGTNVTAVDHLCLGIPKGECFGLLGINGKEMFFLNLSFVPFCCFLLYFVFLFLCVYVLLSISCIN